MFLCCEIFIGQMKTNLLRKISVTLLLLVSSLISVAQDNSLAKYRVTAYKLNDTTIISQSNIVEVMPPLNIYVPNAFTPNGDGINDLFGAKGDGIIEFNIQIFNRWGELVFESSDINKQWDGTYNGEKTETGAYAYSITAFGEKTNQISKSGSVTLVN